MNIFHTRGANPPASSGLIFQEQIVWHPVEAEKPDADLTVLIELPPDEPEPVWSGWFDGQRWYDISGAEIDGVISWAEFPHGTRALKAATIPSPDFGTHSEKFAGSI